MPVKVIAVGDYNLLNLSRDACRGRSIVELLQGFTECNPDLRPDTSRWNTLEENRHATLTYEERAPLKQWAGKASSCLRPIQNPHFGLGQQISSPPPSNLPDPL